MDASKTDRCGYVWPQDPENSWYTDNQNCCYRPTFQDANRCAWHTEKDVSIGDLEKVRTTKKDSYHDSKIEEYIDGANLSGQLLGGMALDKLSLRDADFSDASLKFANLSESDLRGADFSRADFEQTSFEKSDLRFATLPDSGDFPISECVFTGADLREVDLPDELGYSKFERTFIFEHPIDFAPHRGLQNKNDILGVEDYTQLEQNLSSREYFGPPTDEPGRRVCMEYWPNLNVGEVLTDIGWTADFSGKNLVGANLSGAHLWRADFTDAFLDNSDFSEAVCWMADFSNANLRNANLQRADLRDSDLSGADLRDADLSGADLRRANMKNVLINGGTNCDRLYENPDLTPYEWNALARSYHELKDLFGENGLIGKARNHHANQRRSRGLEAKARNGSTDKVYIYSQLSGLFTGYGVSIQRILFWMLALFSFSTIWYIAAGVEERILQNITFSVITFTTSPPTIPQGWLTQAFVMIETFFGTLLVVLLGYILGTRDQF